MKNLILAIGALFLTTSIFAQTFNLTVNNGYGSGAYQAGDNDRNLLFSGVAAEVGVLKLWFATCSKQ
jgi:hypothetical protein